jgi:hypothetical protein
MRPSLGTSLLLTVVLGIDALVLQVNRGDAARNERYAAVAREIAGRPVSVQCPGFWKKLVDVSANEGTVRDGRCRRRRRRSRSRSATRWTTVAGNAGTALRCTCLRPPTTAVAPRRRRVRDRGADPRILHLRGSSTRRVPSATRSRRAPDRRPPGAHARAGERRQRHYLERLHPLLPGAYQSGDCRREACSTSSRDIRLAGRLTKEHDGAGTGLSKA